VAAWLRGLVEVLGLPVYETLGLLDRAEAELATPVRNLRENAKHWKVARLAAIPGRQPAAAADYLASGEQQDALGSGEGSKDDEAPPATSASAVMTVMTLPLGIDTAATLAEGTRTVPALHVLQVEGDLEQEGQQTIVATLPLEQELDMRTTLRNDMSMSLPGTMPPSTPLPLESLVAGSLPLSTSVSGAAPLTRMLGGGGALIGRKVDEIAAGGILGATTAGGGLAEARQGEAAQPPLVPESPSLARGGSHPINVVLSKPRAKLPGEVSPLSEEESIEEKWA